MPRNQKGKVQRKRRRTKRRTTRRRKPASRSQGSGVGRLIAKGVKSLVAAVPGIGPALESVADFAFKALGYALTPPSINRGTYSFTGVENTTQVARVQLTLSTVVSTSQFSIQMNMARKFMCAFCDGRLIRLHILVQPTNPMSKREGEWTMAFQPYFCAGDEDRKGFGEDWNPHLGNINKMYLSATGSASRPLSLTYRPRVCDGRAYNFQALNAPFGELVIRFSQPNRNSYEMFKADDFACDVIVSGDVELREAPSMPPSDSGGYEFDRTEKDLLVKVGMYVHYVGGLGHVYPVKPGFTCGLDSSGRSCNVTGETIRPKIPSLDSMAIE